MKLQFIDLSGLSEKDVMYLNHLLYPLDDPISGVQFYWLKPVAQELQTDKSSCAPTLNVHAPAFESNIPTCEENEQFGSAIPYSNGSTLPETVPLVNDYFNAAAIQPRTLQHLPQSYPNGEHAAHPATYHDVAYSHDFYPLEPIPSPVVSTFKLNPTVSSFVPQSMGTFSHPAEPINGLPPQLENHNSVPIEACDQHLENQHVETPENSVPEIPEPVQVLQNGVTLTTAEPVITVPVSKVLVASDGENNLQNTDSVEAVKSSEPPSQPSRRSWADVARQKPNNKVPFSKIVAVHEKVSEPKKIEQESNNSALEEDKLVLTLAKHLYFTKLNFKPVLRQARGLINRRNWCYINAPLQSLFACSPFYTFLRELPLGPAMERGRSSTPVLDSMVKMTYEFTQFENPQEEFQPGAPFQPDVIYDMLRDLKFDYLKGHQEDAEEFLSFILNGMHEEMVKVIKYYEKKSNLNQAVEEIKENGDVSEGEDEWQVIGSKHKGMVTRKVAEHKTPISDLLGGQIKSFLTTSGNKTSASIQPFFTLQLDIQSDNVTSVSEALKEMTVKAPIQGYTCAKTKQEVEAFSHIALQKLPPILILHLKRFLYNISGGCKKVMKKTDYPLTLEIGREMFSSDVKKNQRLRQYKLFAVMYHDGEEAVKGHYISDVYNHGSATWIRCDDRTVTPVTEEQVLSHTPPRVPYLLFYQES